MCNAVHRFYYIAQDGHRSHCPTIHSDVRVSPLWLMPPVCSILNVFLDTPVEQDFQAGVLRRSMVSNFHTGYYTVGAD